MTCEEWEQILLDMRHRMNGDGWMWKVTRSVLIKAHIENCPACTTKMIETTKLNNALDQLRVATKHFQASPAVEKHLLEAFRRETSGRHHSLHMGFGLRLARLSTAALALIVAGILLYPRLRPTPLVTDQGNGAGDKVRTVTPSVPELSINLNNQPRTEDDRRSSGHRIAKVRKSKAEASAKQMAIPAEDLSLNGGGSIVRVTLPLSGLLAMGVPVHPEASDPRVTADVTLDPFGAVVGVHLVDAESKAN
jgi:hypothetical protein